MSRLARIQRRAELAFGWLVDPMRRPLLYFAMGLTLLLVAVISFGVYERQAERHARNQAIALAIKVQHTADVKASEKIYRSQLASCERGISLRLQMRENAIVIANVHRVLRGFLKGARPRAFAQSQDGNISARSRIGAKHSLISIDNGIAALSAPIVVPPLPTPCDQVITDPNAPTLPRHS